MRRGGQTPGHDVRHDVGLRNRTNGPRVHAFVVGCRAPPTSHRLSPVTAA